MIGVIINPHSRRNRGRTGLRRRIERVLGKHGRVIETLSVDAIIPALKIFADEGRRYWVADGGDGALHWMLNEGVRYFGAERATEMAVYVPTGGGSVDFVAQALGMPREPMSILNRLTELVAHNDAPRIVRVRSLDIVGSQILYGNRPTEFRRVGFANAFAGYGANFFGPLESKPDDKTPSRIARLMATAFAAGAARAVLRGPLERLKPAFVEKAEHDYLRALRAVVHLDGRELIDKRGQPVREHTALQCASMPLSIAGILRVFPRANLEQMHAHAGFLTPIEMARIFPRLMTGRALDHLLPHAFDGPVKEFRVECTHGDEMTPVIDGEIFYRLPSLTASLGPIFSMGAV